MRVITRVCTHNNQIEIHKKNNHCIVTHNRVTYQMPTCNLFCWDKNAFPRKSEYSTELNYSNSNDKAHICIPVSRVIALPSVKYSGRVETDALGGARWVVSKPFSKITIDWEPCMTILLE